MNDKLHNTSQVRNTMNYNNNFTKKCALAINILYNATLQIIIAVKLIQ